MTDSFTHSARVGKIALMMIVIIVAFYVLREHWDHILGSWAYLILLLCPAIHLLNGHGQHHRDS